MKIKLKRLKLVNFKGVRDLDLKFRRVTNISGDNATGKTSVFDAFLWLFFGKDSTDRKDFEIKTLGPDNQPFHKMDHEVTAYIEVDDQEIVIRRVYQENWKTTRGESEEKLVGHVQSFYWNDVPLKLEEFQAKVAKILPENIFKLITNTWYFNGLKWQDRRRELTSLAGDITQADVMAALGSKITKANQHQFASLFNNLNAGKTVDEFTREIASKRTRLKDELRLLPARIDESQRGLPEEQDYDQLELDFNGHAEELKRVEAMLLDDNKAMKEVQDGIRLKMNKVQEHKNRMMTIEFEEKNRVRDQRQLRDQELEDLRRDLRSKRESATRLASDITRLKSRKEALEREQAQLRERYNAVNGEKLDFKDGQFSCPACKREFAADDIAAKKTALTQNFNQDKARRLGEIKEKGKALGEELKVIVEQLVTAQSGLSGCQENGSTISAEITRTEQQNSELISQESLGIQRAIANNKEHLELKATVAALEEQINAPQQGSAKEGLLKDKRRLEGLMGETKELLYSKQLRETGVARVKELKRQESEASVALADLEGIDFIIQQYHKAEMDLLEARVNDRFKLVKFKLFQEQINGGESPCCETLIKGVPWTDANTASKINAGLDIINTLSSHYKAFAPVFIDNAESVNTLIPVNSQLIRLVVTKDKKLKIDSPKEELDFETA